MEMKKNNFQKGEIVIYKTPKNEVEVRFEKETVWLRQDEIARLYGKERSVITKHINNIFRDKEVDKKAMCKNCTLLVLINRLLFTV